jgi:DNA-binding transcriptional MerR regulator
MAEQAAKVVLPPIPAKRYFTIGEVSDLCGVKPHVLRYWEQEFTQLKPVKRRGNRRYYQHHEVLLIRRIRELLYEQGFTISGARNRLGEIDVREEVPAPAALQTAASDASLSAGPALEAAQFDFSRLRSDLGGVLDLLRAHAA